MVIAELYHNPYLLLTKVKFNGQTPKINSQIEKYEKRPLKEWVRYVPEIFYNEMNGYDFDLFFTGTIPDFEAVTKAFNIAGVGEDQVRLFHKNEIEDANLKSEEISSLLSWIQSHPNKRFDYEKFWNEYSELFEGRYPMIAIGGNAPGQIHPTISPDLIDSAEELADVNMTNIPIVFYIRHEIKSQFRKDLDIVLGRKDISHEQLFFMIDPILDAQQIIRVIQDLGVKSPCIVESYNDERIISYIRDYPMADYVRFFITIFFSSVDSITNELEKEIEESKVTNELVHKELEQIDSDISRLKDADEYFVQRDNFVIPYQFNERKSELTEQIRKWKSRKMRTTGEEEAEAAAINYSEYLSKIFDLFSESIESLYKETGRRIEADFSSIYAYAGVDLGYAPEESWLAASSYEEWPDIKDELLTLKEIKFEESKEIFGFLKKTELPAQMNRVVTCNLEQWRIKAIELLLPIAERQISNCVAKLKVFYDSMADEYHKHISNLIKDKSLEKEKVLLKLSEDERKLQEDNNWLAEVRDRLNIIERG